MFTPRRSRLAVQVGCRHARSSAARLSLALCLAASLLLAQGFGLLHRVAHGGAGSVATAPAVALSAADSKGLFDGHRAGDVDCRLLDQLTHADALLAAAVPVGIEPAQPTGPALMPTPTARRALALYRARAPPRG